MKLKYSIIVNIILIIAVLFISYKTGFHKIILNKFKLTTPVDKNYKNKWQYHHEIELYKHYKKQANVVMLGNSITYRANWNELLNRNDIANRGIGNDITEGMLNRLNYVYNVNPQICFIMAGINDLLAGIEISEVSNNIEAIIVNLKNNNIKPIVFSVLYTSKEHINYKNLNTSITKLNERIKNICLNHNCQFINLNTSFSKDYKLKNEYSLDGIHLTASGYSLWKNIIDPILKQEISR
ncbi:GDSL family lipase [Winogradskyella eckloniae]|uniref:GDSL-type esterase/lipase family protein n=1 Tax=Winogradskyella eckloniae TaxID=1089306 RepID=UPI001567B485|nr:GDSL-type esterase/lipase family protein [Winogradskyella eckloniae]NRD20150.1 GDSL family lipase [Winogradskyella eckloniae]